MPGTLVGVLPTGWFDLTSHQPCELQPRLSLRLVMSQIQGCTGTGWSWDRNPGVSGLFKVGEGDRRLCSLGSSINCLSLRCYSTSILLLACPLPRPQLHASGSQGSICGTSGASLSQSASNLQPWWGQTIWETLRNKGIERDPQNSWGKEAGYSPALHPILGSVALTKHSV